MSGPKNLRCRVSSFVTVRSPVECLSASDLAADHWIRSPPRSGSPSLKPKPRTRLSTIFLDSRSNSFIQLQKSRTSTTKGSVHVNLGNIAVSFTPVRDGRTHARTIAARLALTTSQRTILRAAVVAVVEDVREEGVEGVEGARP